MLPNKKGIPIGKWSIRFEYISRHIYGEILYNPVYFNHWGDLYGSDNDHDMLVNTAGNVLDEFLPRRTSVHYPIYRSWHCASEDDTGYIWIDPVGFSGHVLSISPFWLAHRVHMSLTSHG